MPSARKRAKHKASREHRGSKKRRLRSKRMKIGSLKHRKRLAKKKAMRGL